MKTKIILLTLGLFLTASLGFSQGPNSFISTKSGVKKFHEKSELDRMPKGILLKLYIERTESLTRLLPYIAFATKPGITMEDLGIPDNDGDNTKALAGQYEATADFLENTSEFQKKILPYADTSKLVSAILFYEETLRSLHTYDEYH